MGERQKSAKLVGIGKVWWGTIWYDFCMTDVQLYDSSAEAYDRVQYSRPDYAAAIEKIVEFASEHLSSGGALADFCCGTGSVSKRIAEAVGGLGKVVLVDINPQFLEIAKDSNILSSQLETVCGDILSADIPGSVDVVLSAFAYHHVPDADKAAYIGKMKDSLKPGGIVLWAEIYSPNREQTISYYDKLFLSVPEALQAPELRRFLSETAHKDYLQGAQDDS